MSKQKANSPMLGFFMSIFAAMLIWWIGVYNGEAVQQFHHSASVWYESKTISAQYISKVQKEIDNLGEAVSLTLWDRTENQTISDFSTGKKTNAAFTNVYGKMADVVGFGLSSGSFVMKEDSQGCVVDENTAYALWGNKTALSQKLIFDNKEYIVRGILRTNDRVVLVQNQNKEYKFGALEIDFQSNQIKRAEDFLMSKGLPTPQAIVDGYFLGSMAGMFNRISAWIIAFVVIAGLFKKVIFVRKYTILFLLWLGGTIFVTLFLLWAVEFQIHIPDMFVPTKWSDFEFWSNRFNQIAQSIQKAESMTPSPQYTALKYRLIISLICSLLSSAILIYSSGRFQFASIAQMYMVQSFIIAAMFFIVILSELFQAGVAMPKGFCISVVCLIYFRYGMSL